MLSALWAVRRMRRSRRRRLRRSATSSSQARLPSELFLLSLSRYCLPTPFLASRPLRLLRPAVPRSPRRRARRAALSGRGPDNRPGLGGRRLFARALRPQHHPVRAAARLPHLRGRRAGGHDAADPHRSRSAVPRRVGSLPRAGRVARRRRHPGHRGGVRAPRRRQQLQAGAAVCGAVGRQARHLRERAARRPPRRRLRLRFSGGRYRGAGAGRRGACGRAVAFISSAQSG